MTSSKLSRRGPACGLAGALLLASLGGIAHADGASVWSMKGERNTVYLAGSVHALPQDQAGFSTQLEMAYEAADALVMEVDLDDLDPLEAVEFITSRGTLTGPETLADVLGAEKYRSVSELAASVGLPEFAIAKLEPWAAALMLTQVALMSTGYDPQLGIDMQLMNRARADRKPIEGLETIEDQLGIFDGRSTAEQVKFLVQAANDVPEMRDDLERLIRAWREGDLAAMERELQEERSHAPALYDQLLGARNRAWMPKIEALLTAEQDYLVVVGTLHFVGRDGLLQLLKRAGHKPVALAAPAAR
jgi:uncharacterized protein YbaP (TraB family)